MNNILIEHLHSQIKKKYITCDFLRGYRQPRRQIGILAFYFTETTRLIKITNGIDL